MPSRVGGVRQIALASLQTLDLDVAAERGLLGGHQIAGIARRDSNGGGRARHRQFGIAQMCQNVVLETIKQRGSVKRLVRRTRMHPVGEGHRDEIQPLVHEAGRGGGIDVVDRLAHAEQELIGQPFKRTICGESGCRQRVERAVVFLDLQERARVRDRAGHLEPISDDPGIEQELVELRRCEPRDLRGIEVGERATIAVTLVEDRRPRQACLRSFEDQELEMLAIIVDRHAPLGVVVRPHRFARRPCAARSLHGCYNETCASSVSS